MNKKIVIGVFILLIISLTTAGAVAFLRPYDPLTPPKVNDDGFTVEGIKEVANANNKFAFDFYKQLTKESDDIFFSPYSISSALAMTYEGANGETAQEMKQVLHFPDTEILRPNFASIYNTINKKEKKYELRTGNALWVQKDYKFLPGYFTTVENYYGGKAVNLDFVNETELSRNTINTFIEEQTNNRIKELLPQGSLGADTRLVLTNAIYFKGSWKDEFEKKNTKERDFKTPTGTIQVPMMFMAPKSELKFNYFENEELQAIELPYKDKELSMIIFLPKSEDGLSNLENEMDFEKFSEWISNLKSTIVDEIYFPKFEFEIFTEVVGPLKELGMSTAFYSGSADFSKITGNVDLYISDILHKAFIKVDEEGTEAAAATAVIMRVTSAGPELQKVIFKADHPFMFLIKENSTGTILFMGRITDPSS